MKKFFLYFFAFVFVCFLMPALLTKQDKPVNSDEIEENSRNQSNEVAISNDTSEGTKYDYKNYGPIQLLHKKTGEVEDIELDTYLSACLY